MKIKAVAIQKGEKINGEFTFGELHILNDNKTYNLNNYLESEDLIEEYAPHCESASWCDDEHIATLCTEDNKYVRIYWNLI